MRSKSGKTNAQIRDERYEQILHSALKVFALQGFATTRIEDIASDARLSHGLFYHYFSSKEEIFTKLAQAAIQASNDMLLAVDALPLTPLEKVRQVASRIMDGISGNEETSYRFLIMTRAAMMGHGADRENCLEGSDTTVKTMANILEEGQRCGQIIDGDPLEMAVMFFSTTMGLAVYRLTVRDFRMPDAELLINMVRNYGKEDEA